MIKLVRYEIKKMLYKTTTWLLLALSAAIAVLGLVYKMNIEPWIDDISRIYSMCEASLIREPNFGLIMLSIIVPLFASLINSDTYYQEHNNHSVSIYIIKKGRTKYYISKAIVVLISSFIISILPFVINQLLCQMVFPVHDIEITGGYYQANNLVYEASRLPYIHLYYNNPLMYNYLHILFVGLFGALMGLASYVFSLYYEKKNKLIMITFSTIICFVLVLFAVSVTMNNMVIIYYLLALPTISNVNIVIFYFMLGSLLFLCVIAIIYKITCKRDVI